MKAIEVYQGSNGDTTLAYYDALAKRGPVGEVARELFRANKTSSRAKQYRGGIRGQGSFRGMAYEKKRESLEAVCRILARHADELGIIWGWKEDPHTPGFEWVLYIDLINGQVSFHAPAPIGAKRYPREWDHQHKSEERIIQFCDWVMEQPEVQGAAMKMPFGKYRGEEIADIADTDYLRWCEEQSFIKDDLRKALQFELERRSGDRPGMGRVVSKGS